MSYIEDNLMPNEKIILYAKVHPAIFLQSIIIFIAGILIFFGNIRNIVSTPNGGSSNPSTGTQVLGISMLCFSLFIFLSAIILAAQALIIMLTTEFGVTNYRVIAKTGFIKRVTLEILLLKIESVGVNQNILGRILNYGTVSVTGTGGTKGNFRGIVDPLEIRKEINLILGSQIR